MAMVQKVIGATLFGMVISGHLIFKVRRGRLRRLSYEVIPLHHVASATLEIRRYPTVGTLLVLVAVACDIVAHPIGIAVATLPLAVAVSLMCGIPLVEVNTVDGDLLRASGLPWARPEAEWFVSLVNKVSQSASILSGAAT
jgi:hypothetical protein